MSLTREQIAWVAMGIVLLKGERTGSARAVMRYLEYWVEAEGGDDATLVEIGEPDTPVHQHVLFVRADA